MIRRLLVAVAAAALGLTTIPAATSAAPTLVPTAVNAAADNPVVRENRLSGTNRWEIPWSGYALADDVNKQVKGYASKTSVNIGESISLMVHSRATGNAAYNIYRLGWYGGAGGRQVDSGSLPAGPKTTCPTDSTTGLIRCSWPAAKTFTVPSSWTSGIYVVVLSSAGYQNYIPFTVRDDARAAKMVAMQAVNTYQAYNNYPNDQATGKSLYAYNSYGATTAGGSKAAVKVSFDRPYSDHGASTLFIDAAPIARYLEARGNDVKYVTNVDVHEKAGLLNGVKSFVSMGHDEYYSYEMFDAAENARDAGTGLSFFGGNDIYWQVRLEDSGRTVVCYRDAGLDPNTDPSRETILWRGIRYEQPLLGAMWPNLDGAGLVGAAASWVVSDSSHWFYRGTQLSNGSTIAGLVGGEADRRLLSYPGPNTSSWNVLASSRFTTRSGGTGLHEATAYKAPSGAWVFDAGTLNYANGVGGAGISNPRVQTMSTNLLTRQSGAKLTVTKSRAGGPTRYETAVEASQHAFASNFGGPVYITTGLDFPDALGASAATQGKGPVLLVPRSSLPTAVRDELVRLKPGKVFIVGGSDVVTDDVIQAVQAAIGVTPQRVAGPDRYATDANLSAVTFAPGASVAYVATGRDFPDALAAGTAGAQLGGPVLLTQPTGLPTSTLNELQRLKPQRIVVAGGSSVVSDSVLSALSNIAPTTRRAGADRYATANEIARDARGALGGGSILLATGMNYPDALAAGPVAAAKGGSLVLVPTSSSLPVTAAEEIVRNDPNEVMAVGDISVVPEAQLNAAVALFDTVNGVTALSAPQRSTASAIPQPALPEPTGKPLPPELEHAPDTTLPWLTK